MPYINDQRIYHLWKNALLTSYSWAYIVLKFTTRHKRLDKSKSLSEQNDSFQW